MIELHIITKKPAQVTEMLEMLLIKGLIVGATVLESSSSYLSDKGKIKTVPSAMLIGRTKAALFNKIEKLLQEKYGKSIPAIYGMPIVGMDKNHTDKLYKLIKNHGH
jgi:uncharacterized protein involved in tolerance to divalent cations